MTALADGATFDLGRVLSATFGVLGRNFLNLLSLAIVLVGIPDLAASALLRPGGGSASATFDPGAAIGGGLAWLVMFLISIITVVLLQAVVVTGAISDLNGRKIDIGAMIAGRLGLTPVLVTLAVVQGIAQVFGFILLLVPGLIMITVWAVAVPAVVIEKTGVFRALSRSADLTRGHGWGIFGLIAVYWIGAAMLGALLRGLLFGVGDMFPIGQAALIQQRSLGPMCFNAALSTLATMVSATGIAVIYYELRRTREGGAPQAVIDTFS